jgi:hypothetical protein
LFVHFSGWDIDNPNEVSRHAKPYRELPDELMRHWREWAARYRTLLLENGYRVTRQWPYAFEKFNNGAKITRQMRHRQYVDFWNGVPQTVSPFARGEEFEKMSEPHVAPVPNA